MQKIASLHFFLWDTMNRLHKECDMTIIINIIMSYAAYCQHAVASSATVDLMNHSPPSPPPPFISLLFVFVPDRQTFIIRLIHKIDYFD